MHRSRRLVVSAMGGFKIINGPPINGKGPMNNEKELESSNEASLPQPTQAGRIGTCMELIRQARKCLNNDNKECAMKLIELLIKNQCHDGRVFGREVADKVKDVVHELWLVSDHGFRCEMLKALRDLGLSKRWVYDALSIGSKDWNNWLVKCSVDWKNKTTRNKVIKVIESLLREEFSWSEAKMCKTLLMYIGVNVETFRRYGVEPCIWLEGINELSNLRNPYWLGLAKSDLTVEKMNRGIVLVIGTTNTIDAVFFAVLLGAVKVPSLEIEWGRIIPGTKYISKSISTSFYIILGIDEWPWPIKLSADELEKILNSLSDEGLAMFIAGMIDGDGMVYYDGKDAVVRIITCKACPKRLILDVLRNTIAKRFGIVGTIDHIRATDILRFYGENAVRLLRRVVKYMHHSLKRLRAELILMYYEGRIDDDKFEKLYEQTKYELGAPDVKRNHGLEALARAAPQTHTHGGTKHEIESMVD